MGDVWMTHLDRQFFLYRQLFQFFAGSECTARLEEDAAAQPPGSWLPCSWRRLGWPPGSRIM